MNIGCCYTRLIGLFACFLCGCAVTPMQFTGESQQYGIRSNGVDDHLTCSLVKKTGKREVIFDQYIADINKNVEFGSKMAYGNNAITCKAFNTGGPFSFDFTIWTKRAPSAADPWPRERELYHFHGYCSLSQNPPIPECDTSLPVAKVTVNINNRDPAIQ
ncbi:hypothetical protein LB521_26750 [Mesorhizobium sp. BR-1-1-8]|uniref:hypothetical protein n=1 Tax=Mesorhizobium sp. BR-1-1-8 TaxID=2876659 RepID=UPI001CCA61EA|nr:hypothetical protein [Mesorhizobium sp. BR-1-1-8]MBZ9984734.1 hypothetical protein [Mesorhizobium sp. BR-1-1-8]